MEARLVGHGSDLGEDRVLTVVLGCLGRPVVRLELGGSDEPDLAVESSVVDQSTYSATAISTSPTDFQPPLGRMTGLRMHSALNSELSASAIALSYDYRPWNRPMRQPRLRRAVRCSELLGIDQVQPVDATPAC